MRRKPELKNEPGDSAEVRAKKERERRGFFGRLRGKGGPEAAIRERDDYWKRRREAADQRREVVEKKRSTREGWMDLRESVLANGGIRDAGEDYRYIPRELRRKNGAPLDVIEANMPEHERTGGDLVAFENRLYRANEAYKRAKAEKLEKMPRRPVGRTGRRLRRGERHADAPEVRQRLDEYNEMQKLIKSAQRELGKDDPAVKDLKASARELRSDYLHAAQAAGVTPASV